MTDSSSKLLRYKANGTRKESQTKSKTRAKKRSKNYSEPFWGWNVHIWWPAHRKTIKPLELRRKLDKKTWTPLQNAKWHWIHKHQKGNAATWKKTHPAGWLSSGFRGNFHGLGFWTRRKAARWRQNMAERPNSDSGNGPCINHILTIDSRLSIY